MQRFLCWDEKGLSENSGVTVVQHKPEKKNLALVCDGAWEGVHNGYATVIRVGETYRMYYRAAGQAGFVFKDEAISGKSMICVAESRDGITFTKPRIGKIAFNGSKENNAVFWRDNGRNLDTFSVFCDPNPACPPEEKFKALARDSGTDILDYYASADGYDFTFVQKIELNGTFDSYNAAYWDGRDGLYHLYFRGFHHRDGSLAAGFREVSETGDVRDVRLAVSRDFRNWDFTGLIRFEVPQEIQLYTNQIAPYYRAPSTLLGLPTRYRDRASDKASFADMPLAERRAAVIEKHGRGGTALTDCAIMTSADGVTFDLRPGAFLTPGPENDANWWYGDCYVAYGMAETLADDGVNREISLYMGENYRVKKVDFRRYTVRLDGFFSWYAAEPGTAVTKPFVLEGDSLSVNFASSALGGLSVALLDESGKPIEGYQSGTLFGDSTDRPVRFEKDLAALRGRTVCLRFGLSDCHLYSFSVS